MNLNDFSNFADLTGLFSLLFSPLLVSDILLFALIGVIAGMLSGLLGIGGGTILVPIFLYALPHYLPAALLKEYLHHIAVATSIACIFLTACVSALSHLIKKFMPEKALYFLAAGSLLGSYLNIRYLFLHLPGKWIHILFIIFLWINIYYLYKSNKSQISSASYSSPLFIPIKTINSTSYPYLIVCFFMGMLIATISSTIGLGGGFLVVPLLLRLGFKMHFAIACSVMNGVALAIGSLLGYHQLGLQTGLFAAQPYMWGFIYIPAVLIIAPMGGIAAFFATRIAYRVPHLLLKQGFAVFLLVVSIILLLK